MSENNTNEKRVIVIGAGMSGLACARELQQRRYKVLVLEARGRVGGRVWGSPIATDENDDGDSTDVDLGGALIHGTVANPLSQICTQLGIPTSDNLRDCLLLDANGWPVDPKEDDKVAQLFDKALEEAFEKASEEKKKKLQNNKGFAKKKKAKCIESQTVNLGEESNADTKKESDNSFGHLFDEISLKKYGSTFIESPLWIWHQANLELSCGTSFDELGYSWNDDEAYGFDGAHVALCESWKGVVEALAEPLEIVYDCPVVGVEISKDGIDSLFSRRKRKVFESKMKSPSRKSPRREENRNSIRRSSRTPQPIKRFVNDTEIYDSSNTNTRKKENLLESNAEKVYVTLQNGSILEADAVVCTLPLGVLKSSKIQFVPTLPPAKEDAISKLGCGLLNKCALSFKEVFWQDSDFLGMAGENSPFLILNGHKITGKPILIFMFGGESAHDVDLDWNDEDLVKECMSVLRKVSKNAPSAPLDYIVTRWGQDSYSKMSFSYVPPGVDGTQAYMQLSEPLLSSEGKPLVMFAGEHTTCFHPSTMHGAFLSGIREAYRYDLTWEPRLNDEMAFNPASLYKRTFILKRKKDGQKPAKVVVDGALGRNTIQNMKSTPNGSNGASSRHRRHGVMELRKKKNTVLGSTKNDTKSRSQTKAAAEILQPSRKSARTIRLPKSWEDNDDESAEQKDQDNHQNGKQKRANIQQYERKIRRLAHAYQNWQVVQDKVLPLYGASQKKTHVLKQSYQSLRKKIKRNDTKPLLLAWKVGEVTKVTTNNDQKGLTSDLRKSKRKVTPRVIRDI